MKAIKTAKGELLKGLKTCRTAHGRDVDMPGVYKCFRMEASGGKLVIEGVSAARHARSEVPLSEPASDMDPFAVDAESIYRMVAAIDAAEITIKPNGAKVSIEGGASAFRLSAAGDLGDWPKKDGPMLSADRVFPVDAIGEMIRKVKFAVNQDIQRPALAGIHWMRTGEMVATDGMLLAYVGGESVLGVDSTIPAEAIGALEELVKLHGGEKALVASDGKALKLAAADGGWSWRTRLVAREYPAWRAVVPGERENTYEVDREALTGAIGRALLTTEGIDNLGKLTAGGTELVIRATAKERGAESVERLVVKHEGEEATVAVNLALLKNALACLDEDDLTIAFGDGTNPIVMESELARWTCVIMPCRQ